VTPTCKFTRSARRDLQDIADFWTSEAGENQALQVLAGVMQTMITMSAHPRAGVLASQFGADVRKFPAGQYMIYYRPWAKGIEILHVFHGARDQNKAWKPSRPKPPGK